MRDDTENVCVADYQICRAKKNPEFQLFGVSSSHIFLVDAPVNKLTMRLTSDGNRNPSQKEPQLVRYFVLVKLMILFEPLRMHF